MLASGGAQNHRASIGDARCHTHAAALVGLPSAAIIQAAQIGRLTRLAQYRARVIGSSSNA